MISFWGRGLGEKPLRSTFDGLEVVARKGMRAEHEEGRSSLPAPPEQVQTAVAAVQECLGEDDVVVALTKRLRRRADICHRFNREIGLIGEDRTDPLAHNRMLVDD